MCMLNLFLMFIDSALHCVDVFGFPSSIYHHHLTNSIEVWILINCCFEILCKHQLNQLGCRSRLPFSYVINKYGIEKRFQKSILNIENHKNLSILSDWIEPRVLHAVMLFAFLSLQIFKVVDGIEMTKQIISELYIYDIRALRISLEINESQWDVDDDEEN